MDRISKEKRSWNMSHIRDKNTTPELLIRHELWQRGIRYRKNVKDIFGKPDIFISKYKTAIFVHGCYWHRHKDCKNATTPKTNTEFWTNKFQSNLKRDQIVKETLLNSGIRVIIIWECTAEKVLKDNGIIENIYNEIINGKNNYKEF